jgi:hypothetical protein
MVIARISKFRFAWWKNELVDSVSAEEPGLYIEGELTEIQQDAFNFRKLQYGALQWTGSCDSDKK